MYRVASIALFMLASSFSLFVMAVGCQLPPERVQIRALPEDTPPLPFAELLTRARHQSAAANEAFYVDNWAELEDVARGLGQTSRFFDKALEIPAARKDAVAAAAKELSADADKLHQAAKARDVKLTNQILQRINLQVRQLRLD